MGRGEFVYRKEMHSVYGHRCRWGHVGSSLWFSLFSQWNRKQGPWLRMEERRMVRICHLRKWENGWTRQTKYKCCGLLVLSHHEFLVSPDRERASELRNLSNEVNKPDPRQKKVWVALFFPPEQVTATRGTVCNWTLKAGSFSVDFTHHLAHCWHSTKYLLLKEHFSNPTSPWPSSNNSISEQRL